MATKQGSSSQWLTIGDAAKYIGVSKDTLRRWEKRGKIKPTRSPTNRRYYTQSILDQVMAGNKPAKVGKSTKKLTLTQKIILVGIGSFLIAVGLALAWLQLRIR